MPRTIGDNMSQLTFPIDFRFYFEGMEEIGSIAWKGSSEVAKGLGSRVEQRLHCE